jgi:hypothetical protein
MRFEGEFVPPAIGSTSVPIKIAGRGTVELTDAGLAVSGFAASSGAALLVALGTGVAAGAGAWAVKALFMPSMGIHIVASAAIVGMITGAMAPVRGKSKTPRSLTYSWASVARVKEDASHKGTVLLTIKKARPKGTLHFKPDEGPARLLAELESRRAAG